MFQRLILSAFILVSARYAFADGVRYRGGPVISNVKVYAVLWGPDVAQETQDKIASFYTALVDSTFMDVLKEYNTNLKSTDGGEGSHQNIGHGNFATLLKINPQNTATALDQAAMEVELEAQITSGALPKPDTNTLYMVHFPTSVSIHISYGDSCGAWVADHEYYTSKSFGNVYYAMMPDCGAGFDELTSASSHELSEAVTDPMSPLQGVAPTAPAAWLDDKANEIADLCTGDTTDLIAGKNTFIVQHVWLNSTSQCATGSYVTK